MSLKQEDIIIFLSKMVATLINWVLIIVAIVVVIIVIWAFYLFLFKPYKPGTEPGRTTPPPTSTMLYLESTNRIS